MKKFATISLGILLMVSLFTGCSDSTDPGSEAPPAPVLSQTVDIEFTIPADFSALEATEVDYNGLLTNGYALDQFIPEADVNTYMDEDSFDCRKLFAIEIMSNDEDGNWTPRDNDETDLRWDLFETGYLLPDEKGRTFFEDELITNTFNVKYAYYFKLYRKIDVELNGATTTFEPGAFTTSEITYTKDDETITAIGFPLSNLISDFVTDHQDEHTYHLIAADNWENDDTFNLFSWEDIQGGYWLTEENKAIFLDEENATKWKSVKVLEKIELAEIR